MFGLVRRRLTVIDDRLHQGILHGFDIHIAVVDHRGADDNRLSGNVAGLWDTGDDREGSRSARTTAKEFREFHLSGDLPVMYGKK